ncbi:sialidase family protein [Paenibacillus eucommiae]|uniref:Sialidase domain-containing protein n=1 Tax=Paenibacillus eucommiae TaxID=1355755 RepID=A0ABS4J2N0_9BACL|nr:sialidase family protein [Paenibacillus eucommiae]MBP1994065.1 hypothetical protein [Paenibacillus eucommiae]
MNMIEKAMPPKEISFEGKLGTFITLPDQTLISFIVEGKKPEQWNDTTIPQYLYIRRSCDYGQTWSERELAITFAPQPGTVKMLDLDCAPILDQEGTIHVYAFMLLNWDALIPYRDRLIQMLHMYSRDNGQTWHGPETIDYGHSYTGSLNAVIQLSSGRMVMPFSYLSRRETGCFVSEAILSDDQGYTWRNAHAELVVDNGGSALESGSVEPVVIELRDGRVWMVIRTQTGRLYESYSSDEGETWTVPGPTPFFASNAPAGLVQLDNGRIMMCWNHSKCEPISDGVSYSRQSLVAAIREVDGSWSGYREIAHLTEEQDENHSVCYPWMQALGDGTVLVGYLSVHLGDWMGTIKFKLVKVNPEWVAQQEQIERWDEGLQTASVTSCGVQLKHDKNDNKAVRIARNSDTADNATDNNPIGLTRNFPRMEQGELSMRLQIDASFEGAYIAVSESFMKPNNLQGGMFRIKIEGDGSFHVQYLNEGPYYPLKTSLRMELDCWEEITLRWDCSQEHANLSLNGQSIGVLPQLEQGRGISYVRLNIPAAGELLIQSIASK